MHYTIGFEELKKEVRKYTPEWAAPLTGIPAETITRIAQEFAAAAPHALAHNGWRTSNFINSFHTQRAISILNALVGNWNVVLTASAGEEGGVLGAPPQPPYPAHLRPAPGWCAVEISCCAVQDRCLPGNARQHRQGRSLSGAWLVHLAPESHHVHP